MFTVLPATGRWGPDSTARPRVEIVSCVPDGRPTASLVCLFEALRSVVPTQVTLICERTPTANLPRWCRTIQTAPGTKLSKLRAFAARCRGSLVCVFDPDMQLNTENAVLLIRRALAGQRTGVSVVAYGVVAAQRGRGRLSELVELDKLWSHRVLRPLLWRLGLGVTLPGQFLVVSSQLLRQLDAGIDTYLDDLYLGILVRDSKEVRTICEPMVVGYERSRRSWLGLVAQRIRWMKGFLALLCAFRRRPRIAAYLLIHYGAYHGIPILALATWMVCAVIFPLGASAVLAGIVTAGSILSRRSPLTVGLYCLVFPCLHLLATVAAGVPFNRMFLRRR